MRAGPALLRSAAGPAAHAAHLHRLSAPELLVSAIESSSTGRGAT
jgi:hypothetical protein